jgi:VCBS repeat-containing protein
VAACSVDTFSANSSIEGAPMRGLVLATTGIALLFAIPHSLEAGQITYTIQNYPADQNGASLAGTITTDGAIGNLAIADILSWSWTITPAGGTATTVSSSDALTSAFFVGSVVASQTSITIAGNANNAFALLQRDASGDVFNDLEYDRFVGGVQQYIGQLTGDVWATMNPVMGSTDPWVIAEVSTVPEPSSLCLTGMGAMFGIAYSLARKRVGR